MFLPLAEDEVFELGHAPCLWVGSHATLRACSITGMKQGVFFSVLLEFRAVCNPNINRHAAGDAFFFWAFRNVRRSAPPSVDCELRMRFRNVAWIIRWPKELWRKRPAGLGLRPIAIIT